jgi:hypothetical protein
MLTYSQPGQTVVEGRGLARSCYGPRAWQQPWATHRLQVGFTGRERGGHAVRHLPPLARSRLPRSHDGRNLVAIGREGCSCPPVSALAPPQRCIEGVPQPPPASSQAIPILPASSLAGRLAPSARIAGRVPPRPPAAAHKPTRVEAVAKQIVLAERADIEHIHTQNHTSIVNF